MVAGPHSFSYKLAGPHRSTMFRGVSWACPHRSAVFRGVSWAPHRSAWFRGVSWVCPHTFLCIQKPQRREAWALGVFLQTAVCFNLIWTAAVCQNNYTICSHLKLFISTLYFSAA